MNPYRQGSRVARAYDIYCNKGPDETLRIGLQEMGLKEGTLRGWLRMWSKKGTAITQSHKSSASGRRVGWGKGPNRMVGTVTEPGAEQSGVKFDDGSFHYCVNEWLVDLDQEENSK